MARKRGCTVVRPADGDGRPFLVSNRPTIKRAERRPDRPPDPPANQLGHANGNGQQANRSEPQQECATQDDEGEPGKAQDQQRPQSAGGAAGGHQITRRRQAEDRSRGTLAIEDEIVVGGFAPGRRRSLKHRSFRCDWTKLAWLLKPYPQSAENKSEFSTKHNQFTPMHRQAAAPSVAVQTSASFLPRVRNADFLEPKPH